MARNLTQIADAFVKVYDALPVSRAAAMTAEEIAAATGLSLARVQDALKGAAQHQGRYWKRAMIAAEAAESAE